MMDHITIGTAAVALLAPYLAEMGKGAAKKAGEQGLQKVEALLGMVRRKFSVADNHFGEQALERLEAKPLDAGRQQTLAQVLDEVSEADPSFREDLEQLTQAARQDQRVIQMVHVYGNAQVGNVTTIGHNSGDVNIGQPGPIPPR
jgi:hypothetical protein